MRVGESPRHIQLLSSIIYVLNTHGTHSTVSVIDGSIDKVAAGVTFNIHPARVSGATTKNIQQIFTSMWPAAQNV